MNCLLKSAFLVDDPTLGLDLLSQITAAKGKQTKSSLYRLRCEEYRAIRRGNNESSVFATVVGTWIKIVKFEIFPGFKE